MHATTSVIDFLSDAKVVPSDNEKKVTDEGQSISEQSDKDNKESEKKEENKDTKESEKDYENKDDENAESPKKEEKESVEVTKPVPSKASANQNNASVSTSVAENVMPDGNKSQTEEADKGNQSNPDNSEEVEKETGKEEESNEQPNKEESPEENKDMDSQPVTTSDKNNKEDENKDEVNEEDEKDDEESDDDLERGRLERSVDLAADARRRMQPLAGGMDEIRKLQRNPVSS